MDRPINRSNGSTDLLTPLIEMQRRAVEIQRERIQNGKGEISKKGRERGKKKIEEQETRREREK